MALPSSRPEHRPPRGTLGGRHPAVSARGIRVAAFSGFLLWIMTGCHREAPTGPIAVADLPAQEVRVATVRRSGHALIEEVTGTVRSRLRAAIEANVSGRLARLMVSPGRSVSAGEVLAVIDVAEITARAAQARASAEQADRERQRMRTLLAQEAVTQSEFDAADARARVARAVADEAEVMVGYARVVAPFDGVVTRKLADEGNLVGPGRPIVEIENPSALRFEADVPVSLLDRIRLGERLEVLVSPLEAPLYGTVSELDPTADTASRTARVRLDLPADSRLRAGLFGRMSVPIGESTQVSVPVTAVIRRGQLEFVQVVRDGRARLRMIRAGKQRGLDQEVLAGLEEGETVVASDGVALRDGQPVRTQ